MKKLLCIILSSCMLCGMLTACGNAKQTPTVNESINKYTTEGKVTKLVPDPNATGELTVGVYGDDNFALYGESTVPIDSVIIKFQELYPNVKLNVERVTRSTSAKDYFTKLSTEIMVGKGPDVFGLNLGLMDAEKMAQAGAFADMYEYFEKDKSFNIADYNEKVFYTGQTGGKQYTVPIGYTFQSLLTTKSIAQKYGFDVEKCKDYYSCLDQISQLLKNNPDHKTPIDQFSINERCLSASNTKWIDFENNSVNLETPQVKKVFETLKNGFPQYMGKLTGGIGCDDNTGIKFFRSLETEKYLLIYLSLSYEWLISGANAINSFDEAVLIPLRNINGGITASLEEQWAVRSNSQNIENAYRFLKIYLDPDYIQSNNIDTYRNSIPVSNKAVEKYLQKRIRTSPGFKKISVTENSQRMMDTYLGYLSEIDSAESTMNKKRYDILYKEMQPYFDNKKPYEECIKNAQEQFEIYVSE
ncbi:MAG: ABC transporter substrate-binding protein [Oscillospiraceae bacterium]